MKLIRRRFLLGGCSSILAFLADPAQAILLSGAPGGAASGNMSVQITMGMTTYTYNESGGTDLGNFVGPTFTQKNIKGTTVSGIANFYVLFRQDTSGGRKEVIFGNYASGSLSSMSKPIVPSNAPTNLGTYTVQIFTNGVLETGGFIGACPVASSPNWSAGTITADNHWFASEWRWQSALRPILKTPSQLATAGWMLKYGTTGITASVQNYDNTDNLYDRPMAVGGITKHMGDTGQHSDIGMLPQWVSQYMVDPSGNHGITTELAMRSAGEAAHTVPQCFRNDATNAPISFQTYPALTQNTGQGVPCIVNPATYIVSNPSGWTPDNAHFPACSYIPFVSTGDPYYLEGVIFEIISAISIASSNNGTWPYASPDQDRAWAWQTRSIGMACIALKIAESWGTLPSWLPPSSQYKSVADTTIDFFYNNYVNNAVNYSATFGSGPLILGQETWESDFEPIVLNWLKQAAAAVSLSFTNLTAITSYKTQATIDRTSGSTGWPVAFPVPYANIFITYSVFFGLSQADQASFTPPGPSPVVQGDYVTTWADFWALFWQNQTATFNGYLDPSASPQLHVTAMTSSPNYNNIGTNGGWWLYTGNFLNGQPLGGLNVQPGGSGTGGTGTYVIDPTQAPYNTGTHGFNVTTASPAVVSCSGGSIDCSMAIGTKFRFFSNSYPAPLSGSTDYFVIAAGFSSTGFQFSTSLGGAAVNVSGTQMDNLYIMPYIGSVGSPVAMSVGNGGNSICIPTVNALALDQYNSGYFAQQSQDNEYLMIVQAALAAGAQNSQSGASAAFSNCDTMTTHTGIQYRYCIQPAP